jgi:CDP-6-deoxy-D-xylo-4-hexulose-3-dehydrase
MSIPIKLAYDTITNKDIDDLCSWLSTYPRLTKDKLTKQFENKWSEWLGRKYSVFVNSGSSANLLMLYALKLSGRLKNKKIVLPCLGWSTTISPAIQFDFEILLCDSDKNNLGIDINHLEKLLEQERPSCLMVANILGFPNSFDEIKILCSKYDVILLEDSCESVGSLYNDTKTGCFGLMSTFSTYFGHHFSTIEGGIISTDDLELYEILLSIRSHGWDRDLSDDTAQLLRNKHNIDSFDSLYTFYYPGFNVRPTEIQSFLGIEQLKTIDSRNKKRYEIFLQYDSMIVNNFWQIKSQNFISNFAYPIIHPNRNDIVKNLIANNIECRPLVCGSISKQPFYTKLYGQKQYPFGDLVHKYGMYLPNHPSLSENNINRICNIVNDSL